MRPTKFKTAKILRESGRPAAIRVEFNKTDEAAYFGLRRIAEQDFDLRQTQLARLVLMDFVKKYEALGERKKKGVVEQIKMPLDGILVLG